MKQSTFRPNFPKSLKPRARLAGAKVGLSPNKFAELALRAMLDKISGGLPVEQKLSTDERAVVAFLEAGCDDA